MAERGWGNFPQLEAKVARVAGRRPIGDYLGTTDSLIPRGNGRSYGDSALWHDMLDIRQHKLMLEFDDDTGVLRVQAGCLLADILQVFVPRGWFLKVVPGTKLITVGGAIAADVHGKNHHKAGCFSECVTGLTLLQGDDDPVHCDRERDSELFRATCGGQGLTGVILEARIQLCRIASSTLDVTTYKTASLAETFDVFEQQAGADYSVAWIDCLADGAALGRAHVSIGGFRADGKLGYAPGQAFSVPFYLPRFLLNTFTIKAFNTVYWHRQRAAQKTSVVGLESFFFPLDSIAEWNRLYGRRGFVQYQVVLPLDNSFAGMQALLGKIAAAGKGSFLAVLKLHGPANDNYLSFPLEGYSLALDFKLEDDLFELLDQLDDIVVQHGGRTYLAKDSRVTKDVFERGYPMLGKFRQLRAERDLQDKFRSLQSQRLEL